MIIPANTGGYPDHQYIHHNWDNFKKSIKTTPIWFGGSPPTGDVYKHWADKARKDFKSKFKETPERAKNWHKALKELYSDDEIFKDAMVSVVAEIDRELKRVGEGSRKSKFVKKALDPNYKGVDAAEVQKKMDDYIGALKKLLDSPREIAAEIMESAELPDGNKIDLGFTNNTTFLLKNNPTALTAYANAKAARDALIRAMEQIRAGGSQRIDTVAFQKYKVWMEKGEQMLRAIPDGEKELAVDVLTDSIDGSISHIIGEYMEAAVISTLREGLGGMIRGAKSSGAELDDNGKKIKSDVVATTHDFIDIKMSVKKVKHGSKTTYKQSSVNKMLKDIEEAGLGNDELLEYLLLNAAAHRALGTKGGNAFAKRNAIYPLMEYMAAVTANQAIGNDIDYVFYADQVLSKEELFASMIEMGRGVKRLMYVLSSTKISQTDHQAWYNDGVARRLSELHARIGTIGLKVETS